MIIFGVIALLVLAAIAINESKMTDTDEEKI